MNIPREIVTSARYGGGANAAVSSDVQHALSGIQLPVEPAKEIVASVEIEASTLRGDAARTKVAQCVFAGFGTYVDPAQEGLAWVVEADGDGDNFVIKRYEDEAGRVLRRKNAK